MGMEYWILTSLTAVGTIAFWHRMKIWSVMIVAFNVLFASLFAMGTFYMLANILDGVMPVMAYYNDFIAFTVVFVVVLALLMVITKMISKVDLFFTPKANSIARWFISLVLVLGFAGVTTFVCYEIMPTKPKPSKKIATMAVIDYLSAGSLSPLIGDSRWNSDKFVQEQQIRDAGVYTQTVAEGHSGWKFPGDSSPNAQ